MSLIIVADCQYNSSHLSMYVCYISGNYFENNNSHTLFSTSTGNKYDGINNSSHRTG